MDILEQFWLNISPESLFGSTGKKDIRIECLGEFGLFFLQWIFNQKDNSGKLLELAKGLGTPPAGLEEILYDNINEEKIRASEIDFAINTAKAYQEKIGFTRFQENSINIKDVPFGQIADYILASCAMFPLFPAKKIGDSYFVDGGIVNNLPIESALALGANEIIVIHVEGFGINQYHRKHKMLAKLDDIKVMTLKPKCKITGVLEFKSDMAKKVLEAGYDAGKEFFDYYYKLMDFKEKTIR
jgi:NTE family protein